MEGVFGLLFQLLLASELDVDPLHDVDARGAVEALEDARSIVDVIAYVWEPEAERWRMLTFAETRALWDRRREPTARSRS